MIHSLQKLSIFFLFLIASIFGLTQQGKAQSIEERIIQFHSDIIIDSTGNIHVTELITIYANGNDIQRGIVRSIPVYRKDIAGKDKRVNIDVLSVLCNGEEEGYKKEYAGQNIEIYIGKEDVLLTPGIYKYTIVYESRGHVGFFDTYDELYWNITGNDWDFRIEEASATVTLPQGSKAINTSCYTGTYKSTGSYCTVENGGNEQKFSTTHPLDRHEGLTIAVSFPRDIVKRPPPPTEMELFWLRYKFYICAVLGLLIAGCYYCFTWIKAGKDPEKQVVIPAFKPPYDWAPAIVRYLYKKGFDDKAFTASLVNMAVKGALSISYENKKYRLTASNNMQNLSMEEKQIYTILFSTKKTIVVTDTNHSKFESANSVLKNALKKGWNIQNYFLKNSRYSIIGAIISIAIVITYFILTDELLGSFMILFLLPFIIIGLSVIVMSITKKVGGFFLILWGFFFSGIPLSMALPVLQSFHWITITFLIVILVSYALYAYLIKAPTKLGAKTTAELEGFRMYLKTAEEQRLNLLTPPDKTPELFEKLLPYAIALDVENEWCRKFDDVMKQLVNYQPTWYTGTGPFVFHHFGNSFASSFSSSINRASTSPPSSGSSGSRSWSSGSSGGGSSGGGGGGGGGRGW